MITARFIIAAVGVACEVVALLRPAQQPLLTTIGAFFIGVAVFIP